MGVRRDSPGALSTASAPVWVQGDAAGHTVVRSGDAAQEKAPGGEPCVTNCTQHVTGALHLAKGLVTPDESPDFMIKG